MGIEICVVGHAKSKGPFGGAAKPSKLIARVIAFADKNYEDELFRPSRPIDTPQGVYTEVFLADSQTPLMIVSTQKGEIRAETGTNALGPGYHQAVCAFLKNLGNQLGIEWAPGGDETGYFDSGDRAALEKAMLTWLCKLLDVVQQPEHAPGLDSCDGALSVAMPMSHHFRYPGDLHTPMGPKSMKWAAQCSSDTAAAIKAFPWWEQERSARVLRNLALLEMWFSIAWIPPQSQPAYHLNARTALYLAEAYSEDDSLKYPWQEWAQILDALEESPIGPGLPTEVTNALVRERAQQDQDRSPIGYRRRPLTLSVYTSGWSLSLPAHFEDGLDDDLTVRIFGEQREIMLSHFVGSLQSPVPTLNELIEDNEGTASKKFEWNEDGQISIGFTTPTLYDDQAAHVLRGAAFISHSEAVHLVFITIFYLDAADEQWAIDTFRSLRHGLVQSI